MDDTVFRCLMVTRSGDGQIERTVTTARRDQLPPGELTIHVAYSSLNYKDALSATGHAGVTRKFPHIPGIDAAGTVLESNDPGFAVGQSVVVNGFDLGQNTWGGYGELIRVPSAWAVPLPGGLSLRESMIYGVAGFTAALSLEALLASGLQPGDGDVLVTGSTGGVGSVAVALLAKQGFRVVAATGKPEAEDYLRHLGAAEMVDRAAVSDTSGKALLPARWAGAVDTVGGTVLSTVIRSCRHRACVAASGLVGGVELPLTVYPFILRGVQLVGIDSAEFPLARRGEIWRRLATDWRPAQLESLVAAEVDIADLEPQIQAILAGRVRGRVLVKHGR